MPPDISSLSHWSESDRKMLQVPQVKHWIYAQWKNEITDLFKQVGCAVFMYFVV